MFARRTREVQIPPELRQPAAEYADGLQVVLGRGVGSPEALRILTGGIGRRERDSSFAERLAKALETPEAKALRDLARRAPPPMDEVRAKAFLAGMSPACRAAFDEWRAGAARGLSQAGAANLLRCEMHRRRYDAAFLLQIQAAMETHGDDADDVFLTLETPEFRRFRELHGQ